MPVVPTSEQRAFCARTGSARTLLPQR
jgi:hypothetical protein